MFGIQFKGIYGININIKEEGGLGTFGVAKFVETDGVYLHALTELVGLTAHDDRHVVGVSHHGHHRCAGSRHEVAIQQQSESSQQDLCNLSCMKQTQSQS